VLLVEVVVDDSVEVCKLYYWLFGEMGNVLLLFD